MFVGTDPAATEVSDALLQLLNSNLSRAIPLHDPTTLGRSERCHVRLHDPDLDHVHCGFVRQDDGRLGPDEDERLILEWRPWQDAVAAAESGEICDAKSIVGLFWLARVMEREPG